MSYRVYPCLVVATALVIVSSPAGGVEYQDDFANGIEPEHWTTVTNRSVFTCDDSGGDVFISTPAGDSGYRYIKLCFAPDLLGDFDVSVGFSEAELATVGDAGGSYAGIELGFGDQVFVLARNGTADHGEVASVWVDPPAEWIPVPESSRTGRFRVTRNGSIVTAFFNHTVIHEQECNDEQVIHLCLIVGTDTADEISIRFDDFSIVAHSYSPARQMAKFGPSGTPGTNQFGRSLAIDGDTLVVADRLADGVCREGWEDRCGAVFVFERVSTTHEWEQVATFGPEEDADMVYFGYSVAIEDDTIVVGNRHACTEAEGPSCRWLSYSGVVFIYQRDRGGPGNWGEVAKLEAVAAHEQFGTSVALSGDTLVVGAPEYGYGYGDETEGVRVFERTRGGPDNWGEVTVITPSHGKTNDEFGSAVAISGDTVVVGSPFHDHEDCAAGTEYCSYGSVFVYERNQGGTDNWGEVAEIIVDYRDPQQGLGSSLALDGDTLIVGTDLQYGRATDGGVYVFERSHSDPHNWDLVTEVWRSESFGRVKDVKGGLALISDSDSAALFERSQDGVEGWAETAKLTGTEGWDSGIGYGGGAIGDGLLVVGAPYGEVNCPAENLNCNSGAVYIFEVEESTHPIPRMRGPTRRRRP
jgi:hypothetical protein